MKEGRAPSRDDFPLNAFALLPPSAVSDSCASVDHVPVRVGPEDPVEGEETDAHVDTSSENPMVLLKLNLAHTELRDMIEALYDAIEVSEREIATLRLENARLMKSEERVKAEAAKVVEKEREKRQARDHDLMQTQHQVRELERQKERVHSELGEMQLKLDERDSIITALEETMQQLQKQQERLGQLPSHEAELLRLVEIWASKERSVADNTEHVRAATTGIQRLAAHLQTQLKQVQSELIATEKDHESFRGYLAVHNCSEHVCCTPSRTGNPSSHDELHEMRNRAIALETEKLEAATEIQVLRTKCNEYKKSIRLLSSQNEQVRAREDATHKLIAKYQESAADGTQTIAELQESLVKLCDQLAQERKEHVNRHSEQMRTALESERSLRDELDVLREKLIAMNQDLDAVREASNTVTVSSCTRCAERQKSTAPRNPDNSTSENHDVQPSLLSPPPLRLQPAVTPLPRRTPVNSDSSHCSLRAVIEDTIEDVAEIPERIEMATPKKRNRENLSSGEVKKQAVSCRLCNEEPFGFMVRCQKCKDPFHAGCVKNNGTGAKKRLGHIFKCSNCAPHRPKKVARHDGTGDTDKPTNPEDKGAELQRAGAPPLCVAPSRNAEAIARPAARPNNHA